MTETATQPFTENDPPKLPSLHADWNIWDRPATDGKHVMLADQIAAGFLSAERRFAQWEGKNWLPGEPGQTVLDVACGNGNYARLWRERMGMIYTGCDLSTSMLEQARRNNPGVEFVRGDATALPFPDNHFDVTFCSDLLIHLPRNLDRAVAYELRRVARRWAVLHSRVLLEPPRIDARDRNGAITRYETLEDHLMVMRSVDNGVTLRVRNARQIGGRPGADVFFIFSAWPQTEQTCMCDGEPLEAHAH